MCHALKFLSDTVMILLCHTWTFIDTGADHGFQLSRAEL